MCTRPEAIIAAACTIAGPILAAISGWPSQKPRIVRGLKIKSSGLTDIGPSLIAAKLTSVPWRESVAASTPVAGPLTPSRARRNSALTDSRFDPFRDVRRVDDNEVSADRLELGHELRAPDDVDGLQATRFRKGDDPPSDTGIGGVLHHPLARLQVDILAEQKRRGRGIYAQ